MIEIKMDLFTARFMLAGMRLQMKLMKQTGAVAKELRDMIQKFELLIEEVERESREGIMGPCVGVLVLSRSDRAEGGPGRG